MIWKTLRDELAIVSLDVTGTLCLPMTQPLPSVEPASLPPLDQVDVITPRFDLHQLRVGCERFPKRRVDVVGWCQHLLHLSLKASR